MTSLSLWSLTLLLFAFTTPTLLHAEVSQPFITTFDSVEAGLSVLQSRGFDVNLTIDHQANAQSVDLALRSTTVLFGQPPKLPSQLSKAIHTYLPTLAIDLPEKILLFQDADNKINVKTNTLGYLLDRHLPSFLSQLKGKFRTALGAVPITLGLPVDNGLIETESSNTVETTLLKIETALVEAGFRIPIIYDFSSSGAQKKLIIFGNPAVGTQLMQINQEIGIDLPQKFLIYESSPNALLSMIGRRFGIGKGSGLDMFGGRKKVVIVHNDPRFIARRAGVEGADMLLGNIGMALQRFANIGAAA